MVKLSNSQSLTIDNQLNKRDNLTDKQAETCVILAVKPVKEKRQICNYSRVKLEKNNNSYVPLRGQAGKPGKKLQKGCQ
ncbi:MAG: hypothetical protein JXM68_00850 [Sedimentisphaerales bacterium]|nr:hypothetical protein [Sedimentisphaerales bacterium]